MKPHLIFYDIETAIPSLKMPLVGDKDAFIGIISMVHITPEGTTHFKILKRQNYTINIDKMTNLL